MLEPRRVQRAFPASIQAAFAACTLCCGIRGEELSRDQRWWTVGLPGESRPLFCWLRKRWARVSSTIAKWT